MYILLMFHDKKDEIETNICVWTDLTHINVIHAKYMSKDDAYFCLYFIRRGVLIRKPICCKDYEKKSGMCVGRYKIIQYIKI